MFCELASQTYVDLLPDNFERCCLEQFAAELGEMPHGATLILVSKGIYVLMVKNHEGIFSVWWDRGKTCLELAIAAGVRIAWPVRTIQG